MSILVVALMSQQNPGEATLSMVSAARALGALDGSPFDLLVLGSGAKGVANKLECIGAANVYYSEDNSVSRFTAEAHASAVATVVWNNAHSTVIIPATSNGNDLAEKLARLFNGNLVNNVTGFKADSYLVDQTKEHPRIQNGYATTFLTADEAAFEQAREQKGCWTIAPTEISFEIDCR